jgi:uncharacterized membrane protein
MIDSTAEAFKTLVMNTETFSPVRLNSLCDGVFAIAMTLLVLELKLPDSTNLLTHEQLLTTLNGLGPSLVSYLISFFVIGVYWRVNNTISGALVAVDRTVISDTFKLLLGISLLPLTTQIQGRYGYLGLSTSLYAIDVAVCGLASFKIWKYCSSKPELFAPHVTIEHAEVMKYRLLVAPTVFLASIPISFYSPSIARFSWFLCMLSQPIGKRLHSMLNKS